MPLESDDFQLILGVEGELQDGIPKEKPLGENATIDDIKMPAPQEASLTATCRKVERTAQKNHSPTSSGVCIFKVILVGVFSSCW